MINKQNNLLMNIIETINDDSILIKYIIISLCGLFLINLNIFYLKKVQKQTIFLISILKLNVMVFISIILLLYTYDLIFSEITQNIINKSIELKFINNIDLILLLKIIWSISLIIIISISFNIIRRGLQIIFSSFFIGFNSYFINLWFITEIDNIIYENFFIKWTKTIDKELLYERVLQISAKLETNKLSYIDLIYWVNANINHIYKMNDNEIYNNLVTENNNKTLLNTDTNWYDVISQTNNLIFIISSILIISSGTIFGYHCLKFIFNFNINDLLFNNRPNLEDIARHDINNINELSNVANNIIENNNLAYNSINSITNFMIGMYRVLNDLSRGVNDDINPRLIEAENQINDLILIIERLTEQ